MKEEWLMSGAVVPVDAETTAALVAEIKRLINVVGGLVLKQGPDYERGFVDGMQKQAQSSVDRAVNRMAQPEQEPVALGWLHKWANQDDGEPETQWHEGYEAARRVVQIHLTTPTQRKPLPDMAVFDLADQHMYEGGKNYGILAFARAIEAAHGIKP